MARRGCSPKRDSSRRAFQGYQTKAESTGRLDEHALRRVALTSAGRSSFAQVVVTVADRAADPHGLWTADFDLLARLPGLERLDVVATERTLASGFHARLHDVLPGIEERTEAAVAWRAGPCIPHDGPPRFFAARDREEELADAARLVKRRVRRSGLLASPDRFAVVFQRPLPYLYLARHVFADARIAWQAPDELPLAAEPFAAALDLVLTFLTSGFTRAAGIALLRSPHLRLASGEELYGLRDVAELDQALLDGRFVGGVARSRGIRVQAANRACARRSRDACRGARAGAHPRSRCGEPPDRRPRGVSCARTMPTSDADVHRDRQVRVREAIMRALDALSAAHAAPRRHAAGTRGAGRRRSAGGSSRRRSRPTPERRGVQLVDASAARYGDFDEITLVGLVESDWPDRPGRNIFYPPSLLNQLGWVPDSERLAGARAAFRDLHPPADGAFLGVSFHARGRCGRPAVLFRRGARGAGPRPTCRCRGSARRRDGCSSHEALTDRSLPRPRQSLRSGGRVARGPPLANAGI